MKVAVIGAGLIGQERINAIQKIFKEIPNRLTLKVFDINRSQLEKIYFKYNVDISSNFDELKHFNPQWTIICVPHDVAPQLIINAFKNGSNVLVEKPLGMSLAQCNEIIQHKPNSLKLGVGFNYRFMKSISTLLEDIRNNKFGQLISVNAILGHGNSPEMLNSSGWKLDPIKCGGALIDPGVHLLDLILQINSNITAEKTKIYSGFWKRDIEEEAHILLSDPNNTIYNLQVSLNRWKSTFRLEVNGTEGYGIVEGRGKSYGNQSYRRGKRWGWHGSKLSQAETEEIVIANDTCEDSFEYETFAHLMSSENNRYHSCTDQEALKVMQLLEQCKEKSNG